MKLISDFFFVLAIALLVLGARYIWQLIHGVGGIGGVFALTSLIVFTAIFFILFLIAGITIRIFSKKK